MNPQKITPEAVADRLQMTLYPRYKAKGGTMTVKQFVKHYGIKKQIELPNMASVKAWGDAFEARIWAEIGV